MKLGPAARPGRVAVYVPRIPTLINYIYMRNTECCWLCESYVIAEPCPTPPDAGQSEEVRHKIYDVIDSVDNVWRSGKAVCNQHRPCFVPIFACSSR